MPITRNRNTDYRAIERGVSVVYFIKAGYTQYKIGVSENIEKRLIQLQTGNPNRIKVVHIQEYSDMMIARTIEKHLHRMLKEYRLNGEWFELLTPDEENRVIDEMKVFAKIEQILLDK